MGDRKRVGEPSMYCHDRERDSEREREKSTVYSVYRVIVVLGLYPIFSRFCQLFHGFVDLLLAISVSVDG